MAAVEKNTLLQDRKVLASCGYYVGRKIDSGTFATVRYAEKTSVSGSVPLAVKVIDKAKATPIYTQKFLKRELNVWPKLQHRHIIQVENIVPIQDRIYVFMELAPMGSVIEYVQNHGPVNEDLARSWCKKMCQALRYCHKRSIAHRDLKCDNLLLDKNLQIKIGDFGFCCQCGPKRNQAALSETYCGSCCCARKDKKEQHLDDDEFLDDFMLSRIQTVNGFRGCFLDLESELKDTLKEGARLEPSQFVPAYFALLQTKKELFYNFRRISSNKVDCLDTLLFKVSNVKEWSCLDKKSIKVLVRWINYANMIMKAIHQLQNDLCTEFPEYSFVLPLLLVY